MILIEVRRPLTDAQATDLLGAVHDALVAAFLIPEEDRGGRVVEHPPARFEAPRGLEVPDLFTLITIDCFAGRSAEAKRRLFAEVATRLEAVGVPRGHATVILHEIPLTDWGLRAGVPAADVDLGFDVEV